MRDLPLIKAVAGLNNRVDPTRIAYNADAGVSELAEAVNISIDNTGRPQRRLGWNSLLAGEFHSLWSNKLVAFLVQETPSWGSIMQLSPDAQSVTGILSGLTKNKRMSFVDILGRIYYSNGLQKGIIVDGVTQEWVTETYHDEDSTRQFISVPNGHILERHINRIVVAKDNAIYLSEPDHYGLFDYVSTWGFPSEITMVVSVETGLFVSDLQATYFLQGNSPHDFRQSTAYRLPAHRYSVYTELVDLADLGLSETTRYGALWSCSDGIMIGLPDGSVVPLNKERLIYPDGYTKAATMLCGYHAINTMY